MKFITRFKRLTFWNKLGVLGATCSILGFIGWLLYIVMAPKLQHEREALEAESRPFLSRLFINLPTTKEVGLWIENHDGTETLEEELAQAGFPGVGEETELQLEFVE